MSRWVGILNVPEIQNCNKDNSDIILCQNVMLLKSKTFCWITRQTVNKWYFLFHDNDVNVTFARINACSYELHFPSVFLYVAERKLGGIAERHQYSATHIICHGLDLWNIVMKTRKKNPKLPVLIQTHFLWWVMWKDSQSKIRTKVPFLCSWAYRHSTEWDLIRTLASCSQRANDSPCIDKLSFYVLYSIYIMHKFACKK